MIRYLSSKVNIHLLGVSISFCVMKEKVIDQAGYFGFLNTYPDLFYLADLEMLSEEDGVKFF